MKKLDKAYKECMDELYLHATPSASFDELIRIAKETDDRIDGKLNIHYENYEIGKDTFDSIFKAVCKKHRLSSRETTALSFGVYLGASPKTKYNETNN